MTTAAKITFGTELWLAPAGTAVVKIAELETIDPPNIKRDTVDVTTHDSPAGAMEVISEGVYDPGDIKATMLYVAESVADLALITAATTGAKQDFKIVLKRAVGTQDITGTAFVTDYGPTSMPIKGKQAAAVALKVSGPVTHTATA